MNRKHWVAMAAAGALAVTGAAGASAAVTSAVAADGTIDGCYRVAAADVDDGQQGQLRVLAAGQQCKKNELAIQWNQKGLKGDVGAQGIAGQAGPKGEAGAAGLKGDQGLSGDQGATGPVGIQGVKGDLGTTGDAGAKGDTGTAGETGLAGSQGLQGNSGDTGPGGANGTDGAPGTSGPQGLTGMKGETGLAGPAGPTGPAGTGVGGGVHSYGYVSHPSTANAPVLTVGKNATVTRNVDYIYMVAYPSPGGTVCIPIVMSDNAYYSPQVISFDKDSFKVFFVGQGGFPTSRQSFMFSVACS